MSEIFTDDRPALVIRTKPRLSYRLFQVALLFGGFLVADAYFTHGAIRREAGLEAQARWREGTFAFRHLLERVNLRF